VYYLQKNPYFKNNQGNVENLPPLLVSHFFVHTPQPMQIEIHFKRVFLG